VFNTAARAAPATHLKKRKGSGKSLPPVAAAQRQGSANATESDRKRQETRGTTFAIDPDEMNLNPLIDR